MIWHADEKGRKRFSPTQADIDYAAQLGPAGAQQEFLRTRRFLPGTIGEAETLNALVAYVGVASIEDLSAVDFVLGAAHIDEILGELT